VHSGRTRASGGVLSQPFAAIFKDYDYDFRKIDPMLFTPAVALVRHVASGRSFRGGSLNDELLAQSFGAQRLAPATRRCALRS